MFIFATLGPIVVTALVVVLVGRRARMAGRVLAWRTVLAGALVPAGVALLSIPTSLFGGRGPNTTAQAIIFALELAVIAVIALPVLVRHGQVAPNRFVRVFGQLYLVVLAALWASAAHRAPTPNLAYASICFVIATLAVWRAGTKTSRFATSAS
jgi:hypothetical protein